VLRNDCPCASGLGVQVERNTHQKAKIAVAASILTAIYFVLRDKVPYRDLGHDYFDKADQTKTIARLVRRLNNLACDVELRERAAA
jgi:hypothetical protein